MYKQSGYNRLLMLLVVVVTHYFIFIYIPLVHPGPPRKQMPKVEVVTFEDPLKKPRVQQKFIPNVKIVRPVFLCTLPCADILDNTEL